MAQRITDTPVLKGPDARRFRREMKVLQMRLQDPDYRKRKAEELEKMNKCYEFMKSISNGTFY